MKIQRLLVMAILAALFCACGSGNNNVGGMWGYTSVPTVTFSVHGVASCPKCLENELPVIGMHLELVSKVNPLQSLGFKSFAGLGPFSITGLKAQPGVAVEVVGTLFLEGGADPTTLSSLDELTTPEESDVSVNLSVTFPSSGIPD